MIAAYFLPVRQDTQELVVVPVAQAKLLQMTAKEEAGVLYMRENGYPYTTDDLWAVSYTSGRIDDDVLSNYLPFGFVNNEEYVTAIYCMDKDMTTVQTGEDGCYKSDENKVQRMLITYGPIPERWRVVSDEGDVVPSMDLMQALRVQFVVKEMVGYVVEEGGELYVVNYEGTKYKVPQPVANNMGMSHYGLKDCLNDYGTCLAYMELR